MSFGFLDFCLADQFTVEPVRGAHATLVGEGGEVSSPGSDELPEMGLGLSREKKPVTVLDLARFAVIGDPHSQVWAKPLNEAGSFSPDGTRVAVVIRSGNPENGTNDGELLVYRTVELFTDPHPITVAKFASTTNDEPIARVRWLADNETLAFIGTRGATPSRVYQVNVRTRALVELPQPSSRALSYEISPTGDRLVTVNELSRRPPAEDLTCRRSGCRITANLLYLAEQGIIDGSAPLSVYDAPTATATSIPNPESIDRTIERCDDTLHGGISADGRFALRMCEVREWPQWWGEYTADPMLQSCWKRKNAACARRLFLIDLQSGKSVQLTDAPSVWNQTSPLWIDGGRYVILAGALETLHGVDGQERSRRAKSWSVLLIDPLTRGSSRIARLDAKTAAVTAASWDEKTETLTVRTQNAERATLPMKSFHRKGRHWVSAATPDIRERDPMGMRLVVQQSLNDPPVLTAIENKTGVRSKVLDPNPWLAQRRLGQVEAISWQSKDGRTWRGGLYLPPGSKAGVRYPLVMQTHGFAPDLFSLNGIAQNFAGQALAAHDIAVLQIQENYREVGGWPAEWSTVQAGYEAAIDHLDTLGVIDRSRVGIHGWSRTGPQMGYTLTHSSYSFRAGVFTDTSDFGWLWYLAAGAPPALEALFGAAPFGEGLKAWFELSPAFNLDRVETPMLMWASGTGAALWDWYAGLRRLGKPVEYWIAPDGAHDVFQVGQRINSNQLVVDWFRFWLKGEEDSDPGKKDQYSRWEELHEQQESQ